MKPNFPSASDSDIVTPIGAMHQPVLLKEVLNALGLRSGGVYVDGTVGLGGHAEAILEASGPDGRLIALDQDKEALALAKRRLARFGDRVTGFHANFSQMHSLLREQGLSGVDGILLDLGMSSHQLEHSGRGFSFFRHEWLDMRMNPETGRPASDVLKKCDEQTLEWMFRVYGEERWARRFARAIVRARERQPLTRSDELAALLESVAPDPPHRRRLHPATRVFQALRIVVNDELRHLEETLPAALDALGRGGVLCVISFHSLEDRLVKQAFRAAARPPDPRPAAFELLTKKPLVPSDEECRANPRSRSAKLRAIRRRDASSDGKPTSPIWDESGSVSTDLRQGKPQNP